MNLLIFVSCICLLFIVGKIFIVPIKWIIKLILNSILGGILIYVINLILGIWGLHIGLNIYTSLIVRYSRGTRSDIFNCNFAFCTLKHYIKNSATKMIKSQKEVLYIIYISLLKFPFVYSFPSSFLPKEEMLIILLISSIDSSKISILIELIGKFVCSIEVILLL